jgi:hypothetical protein
MIAARAIAYSVAIAAVAATATYLTVALNIVLTRAAA